MNHSEAVKEMAVERYLLDELLPDARDAFEEHMFDCAECSLDVRSGSMFMGEAKKQLPELRLGSPAAKKDSPTPGNSKQWFAWLRPAFAVPVMATLLAVVGYQNLVTLPSLHRVADQPRIVPVAPLYGATRGESHVTITADRNSSIALPVDLPVDSAGAGFASVSFELNDPKGKTVWSGSVPVASKSSNGDAQISIVVPGAMLENGSYTLLSFGVSAHGEKTVAGRYAFDVVLSR